MQEVTLLTLASCLSAGLFTGLLAYLKLALARKPDTAPRLAMWLPALNLAIALLMGAAGTMADTFGIRAAVVGGSALAGLGLAWLGLGGPQGRSPYPLLVATLGACTVYVCALRLMPPGLLGRHETAASINLGLVYIAVTGLMAPPLFELLRAGMGFRGALTILGLLAASPLFLSFRVPEADLAPPGAVSLVGLASDPHVWAAGLVFFVYAPLEAFIGVWATSYCESHDGAPGAASWWMAWFWIAMSASRVVMALVMHVATIPELYQLSFLVIPALLAAVCLGNMSGSARYSQAMTGLILLGVCLGPVLPMLLSILAVMKGTASGPATAFGILFACGALGSLIFSPLVDWSTREKNLEAGLRIPLFLALALTVTSLFFGLLRSQ
jgi:hypothetical protein